MRLSSTLICCTSCFAARWWIETTVDVCAAHDWLVGQRRSAHAINLELSQRMDGRAVIQVPNRVSEKNRSLCSDIHHLPAGGPRPAPQHAPVWDVSGRRWDNVDSLRGIISLTLGQLTRDLVQPTPTVGFPISSAP